MAPFFSICIPTYNRADLLDYCLTNLEVVERYPRPFEIVISDNASPDHTQDVIAKHRARKPYIRSYRQERNVGAIGNWLNALRQARGDYLFYLADDDGIYPNNLFQHLDRLEKQPEVVGLYTDWVAYDDAEEKEIHRYYKFSQPESFGPSDPLGLINFVLSNQVYPEVAIYSRPAFLQSHCFVRNGYPFHMWLYRLSRVGKVAFETLPFYREHRILKPKFRRNYWTNVDTQHSLIGDEMRNTLETIVLWAFQDTGVSHAPPEKNFEIKQAIDRFLHNRTSLNIQRASLSKDWLLAAELRRRLVLWYGPGTTEKQHQDVMQLSVPCACQAIHETYVSLTNVSGLLFHGFLSQQIPNFFRAHYPDIPILTASVSNLPPGNERQPLIVLRSGSQDRSSFPTWLWPGYQLAFDQLLDNYRVNGTRIDLGQL